MKFLRLIWKKYSKDTRIRHAVSGAFAAGAAVLVLQYGGAIELKAKTWFTQPGVLELIGAAAGALYRWAQTQIEILINWLKELNQE